MEEKGRGFVVDPGPSIITLFQNGQFRRIDTGKEKVLSITPSHTGRSLYFKTVRFSGVGPDSLQRLSAGLKIIQGEVNGSREFFAMGERRKSWDVSLSVGVRVRDEYTPESFVSPEYVEPARIESIKKRILKMTSDDEDNRRKHFAAVKTKSDLQRRVFAATDLVQRQRLQGEMSKLKIPELRSRGDDLGALRAELMEVRQAATLSHSQVVREARERWEEGKSGPLLLSGFFEIIDFEKAQI